MSRQARSATRSKDDPHGMNLPEGKTCADCAFVRHCVAMYGVRRTNTSCDFAPSRFVGTTRKAEGDS